MSSIARTSGGVSQHGDVRRQEARAGTCRISRSTTIPSVIMISCVYETLADTVRRRDVSKAPAARVPAGTIHLFARARNRGEETGGERRARTAQACQPVLVRRRRSIAAGPAVADFGETRRGVGGDV